MYGVTTSADSVNPPHLPAAPDGLVYRRRVLPGGVYFTTGAFPVGAPNAKRENLAWVPALVLDADVSALVVASGVVDDPAAQADIARLAGEDSRPAPDLTTPKGRKDGADLLLHHDLLDVAWWLDQHLTLLMLAVGQLGLTPSAIVCSGFGHHLYFALRTPAATPAEIDAAQILNYRLLHSAQAVEVLFKGMEGPPIPVRGLFDEAVWDCGTRILRLPGTVNKKARGFRAGVEVITSGGAAIPTGWNPPSTALPGGLFGTTGGTSTASAVAVPADDAPAAGRAAGPQKRSVEDMPVVTVTPAVRELINTDDRLALYWRDHGRTRGDTSPSGYDGAVAYRLLQLGASGDDILAALRFRRAGSGKGDDYFTSTLTFARTQHAAQQARNKAANARQQEAVAPPMPEPPVAVAVAVEVTPPPAPSVAHQQLDAPAPVVVAPAVAVAVPVVASTVTGAVDAVTDNLCINSKGVPISDFANAQVFCDHDPRMKDALEYNSRTQILSWTAAAAPILTQIRAKRTDPHPVDEPTLTLLSAWLGRTYQLYHMETKLYPAFVAMCRHHDPLREELTAAAAAWDGTPRLHLWISRTFGMADTPLLRAYATRWLVAAVWRALGGSLNFKHVLALTGPQSTGKSAVFKILAGIHKVCDETLDFDRESIMQIREAWIVEIAELAGMSRRDIEHVKNFISKPSDTIRLPYARKAETVERAFVFAATTNESEFLEDRTGSVRWWVVPVSQRADFAWLEENRLQILGEAVRLYLANKHNRAFCDMGADERAELEKASGATYTADATVADPLVDALKLIEMEMRTSAQTTCSSLHLLERIHAHQSLRNTSPKALANAARSAGWVPWRGESRGWTRPGIVDAG